MDSPKSGCLDYADTCKYPNDWSYSSNIELPLKYGYPGMGTSDSIWCTGLYNTVNREHHELCMLTC